MRAKLFGSRKRKLSTLVLIALLALGGTALAAWLVTGTATFRGQAATLSAPTFSVTGVSATTPMYPGGAGTLDANVSNPNPVALKLTAITATGATITTTDDVTDSCNTHFTLDQAQITSDLAQSPPVGAGNPFTLAAAASNTPIKLTGALKLDATAPTGCQGVIVTVALAANAVSWSM